MITEIEKLRGNMQEYAENVTQAMYKSYLGISQGHEYNNLFENFKDVFSLDVINTLRNIKWVDNDESRALFYLKGYFIGQWYSNMTKKHIDRITQSQIKKEIQWGGHHLSLRQIRNILIDNKLNESHEKSLKTTAAEFLIKEMNPLIFEFFDEIQCVSESLNYKNFINAANDIRRYRVQDLVKQVEFFVEETSLFFKDRVFPLVDELGYNFEKIDNMEEFMTEKAYEDMIFLQKKMNWSLKGAEIQWTSSKQKYNHSFCVPLEIPGRIILVTPKGRGFNNQRLLYHEMGHGFHFMNTNKNLSYEFRRMGDHAVTQAYCAVIESLMFNPSWLKIRGYSEDIASQAYYYRCYLIRKYWSKIASEVEIHQTCTYNNEGKEIFDKWFKKGMLGKYENIWWAYLMDDELNASSQLRGWLLAAQINAKLLELYGEEWFIQEKAGEWLKELFSLGYKYNADEISKIIGFERLDESCLIKEFRKFEGKK